VKPLKMVDFQGRTVYLPEGKSPSFEAEHWQFQCNMMITLQLHIAIEHGIWIEMDLMGY